MTSSAPVTPRTFDPVNISTRQFWALPAEDRDKSFSELRKRAPISWQPPFESEVITPQIPGYWAVTTNSLIREVSTHPELFCSSKGTQMEDLPDDILQAATSFLEMDGAEHMTLRKLMSSAFTPKQLKKIEDQIRARAASIIDRFIELGEGDWVQNVSKQMPMNTFYELAGLAPEHRDQAAHHADELGGWNDPDVAAGREPAEVMTDALIGNLTIGLEFAATTRECPRDDVWSNLVQAEIDGRKLTDDELASMFVLMSFAGNDTTRSTLSLGTKALLDHPDQLAYLLEDFDGRIDAAIEEVLRWVTPIHTFRRTATQDTMLGDQEIREGDWVVMFYASGNRDGSVFEDPWRFDITRKPNPHVAFGGGGPHFCLGNFLAKMQLRHMFDQIFRRMPSLDLQAPDLLVGNFANAVKRMHASTGCPVAH